MRLVQPRMAGFRVVLLAGWAVLGGAAIFFARWRGIAPVIAVPLALAFLTEFTFYLLPGFVGTRAWLIQHWKPAQIAAVFTAGWIAVYFIYAVPTGLFGWRQFAALTAISATVGCWHLVFRSRAMDCVYLAALALIILSGVLRWIYPGATPKLPMDILGHISLIRTATASFLLVRREDPAGFGFVPTVKEIRVGFLWFVAVLAGVGPLAVLLGQARWASRVPALWPSIGTVLGVFWVLALSEEFFFRGLLMVWVSRWSRSSAIGLGVSAILFGACHLWFKGVFPNWRMAVLATAAGACYGAAFRETRSIRASMVTHTLTVATWKLFFS